MTAPIDWDSVFGESNEPQREQESDVTRITIPPEALAILNDPSRPKVSTGKMMYALWDYVWAKTPLLRDQGGPRATDGGPPLSGRPALVAEMIGNILRHELSVERGRSGSGGPSIAKVSRTSDWLDLVPVGAGEAASRKDLQKRDPRNRSYSFWRTHLDEAAEAGWVESGKRADQPGTDTIVYWRPDAPTASAIDRAEDGD